MRAPIKNWRLIDWACAGRTLLFLATAVAIVAGTIALARHHGHVSPIPATTAGALPGDALARELVRCQSLGRKAENDQRCLAAWAENRRRFFGGQSERISHP